MLHDRPAVPAWAPVLIVIAALLTFANALGAPFVFDDFASIVQNQTIRDLGNVPRVLSPPENTPVAGRPLINLSFAMNYAAGGLEPRGYRAVNLTLHIAAALLLLGIVRRTLQAPAVAFAVALLWAIHPLNSEVVNYVTQRTEAMMAALYLLTLYAAVRALPLHDRARWEMTAVAACVAGMACKETMVTAPLAVMLYDRIFAFDSMRAAVRSRGRLYAGLAAAWLVLAALVARGGQTLSSGFETANISPWTYLLNQAVMVTRYLYLAVWPGPLVIYYGWPQPLTLADVWLHGLLVVGLLIATAVLLLRKPAAGFLGAWFFLTLAPTSSVLPIATEVGAERRMYLALAAVITAGVLSAVYAVRCFVPTIAPRPAHALLCALLAALPFAISTAGRNLEYMSALTLAETSLRRWPSANAHYLVGSELTAAGRRTEAIPHLREAAKTYAPARFALGSELLQAGQSTEGIRELQMLVRDEPHMLATRSAHGLLANALAAEGRFDAAVPHYREFLAAYPHDTNAWNGLGIALVSSGRAPDALAAFERALAADPANNRFRLNLARALLDSGRVTDAAIAAKQAAAAEPQNPAPHDILARAAAAEGRLDEALRHFHRALQIDPAFRPALEGLAALSRR